MMVKELFLLNIDRVVKEIDSGNLVITPTDTVYGIMADSMNNSAVKKVFETKNREYSKPLILLVSNKSMLYDYVDSINDIERELIDRYMPGRLTIILKKNNKVSDMISAGSEYVGIRIPDNEDLVTIINKLGRPVISTSANISGSDTITSIDMIDKKLLDKVSYIEDGGIIDSKSSTIVRVIDNKVNVIREGELSYILRRDYL